MATSKAYQTPDLSEHRRKIFFEGLSPKTTKQSLEEYLSGFEIERCVVPYKEGRCQGYGSVIFCKESSVDNVMLKRPHRIDGQHVEIYRSVPDQGSLKEKKAVKNLIVSGIKNGSITKSDLEHYFSGFGAINHIDMTYDRESCCIEFDDYDAVDKALLDSPHTIKRIEVNLMKGNRNRQIGTIAPPKTTQETYNNNNTGVMPKKSNLKQVQIDPRISAVNMPKKVYCIHITNLPSNVDAEILSMKFNYSIDDILINPPSDNQSLPIECWLKGINDLQEAEDFVQRWNGQVVLKSKMECEVEEDKLEFCNKFRIGECPKPSDVCDWEHIICTANAKCSSDCPYGHVKGMKSAHIKNSGLGETYRIRITGFQKKLTPESLAQILHEKKCYINRSQEDIGYVVQLRTMKYARRLMAKWHNKEIDGQMLQCQIELNPRFSMPKALSRSASKTNLVAKEDDSSRPDRGRQQLTNNRNTSRENSISRENSDSEITTLDDQDLNHEGRLFDRSRDDIIKQKDSDGKRKAVSAENLSSSAYPKSKVLNQTPENSRQMSVLRKKTDHGSLACLLEYKSTDEETYKRELNALKLLKDVKGVVQLIDLDGPSNNTHQQLSSQSNLWLITDHTSGYSLKEFVNRIHRGGFVVLEAIQLIQNLITIIKQVHSKGVLHQNLGPENIMIEWDPKQTSADEVQLQLTNFSQAYIKSEKNNVMNQSKVECWYKAPQSNVESLKYSSTIDASSICAILLWLLTNTDARHDQGLLPHQQDNVTDKLDNKIAQAVRNANVNRKQQLEETRLKTYLIDTFNIGFGYPQLQPWTISDLECRLESIRELLSPRNPTLNTTDAVFQDLITTYNTTAPAPSITTNVHQDIFQKASIAFQQAKQSFSKSRSDQYSWSDESCTWLDSTQTSMNERRHDDILTYYYRDGRMSSSCSIIITCLATLIDEGNCITLSIGSAVNDKMIRIPIGRYSKSQNYMGEFQKNFIFELDNLIISITKERRTILQ